MSKKIVQFSLDTVLQQRLINRASFKSLSFGRRLFSWDSEQNQYWLKTHVYHSHEIAEGAFLRELSFYQTCQNSDVASVLMPYQILSPFVDGDFKLGHSLLIIQHGECLFSEKASTLRIEHIQHVLLQALTALEKLHKAGWVHADLKKEHFIVDGKQTKLIDFEHCIQELSINHEKLSLNATPRYMAPELFYGLPKNYATDIYALGIIFLEWLTEQRLQEKSYQDWAVLHCQKLKISLKKEYLCFQSILEAMLSKKKEQRLSDISVLKIRLVIENV